MGLRDRESERFIKRWRKEGEAVLRRIIITKHGLLILIPSQKCIQVIGNTHFPPLKRLGCPEPERNICSLFVFFMEGVVLCHAVPEGESIDAVYDSNEIKD